MLKRDRSPSTVTVTPQAANFTQVITVTAQAAPPPAAEAPSMPAGVMPPAGAAGTGSKTAGIVKTSDASNPDVGEFNQHRYKRLN